MPTGNNQAQRCAPQQCDRLLVNLFPCFGSRMPATWHRIFLPATGIHMPSKSSPTTPIAHFQLAPLLCYFFLYLPCFFLLYFAPSSRDVQSSLASLTYASSLFRGHSRNSSAVGRPEGDTVMFAGGCAQSSTGIPENRAIRDR